MNLAEMLALWTEMFGDRIRTTATGGTMKATRKTQGRKPGKNGDPGRNPVYSASTITRRPRRSKAEIQVIRDAAYALLRESHPMTVRQVFYRLTVGGYVAKTESEYNQTVVRLLLRMRLEGDIPFSWIADNTRWMRKPTTFSSLEAAPDNTARTYRRDLWDNQEVYVEVWCEKDALAGVLLEETRKWDVPLMVSRGFSSVSFLYTCAKHIGEADKPACLYYFGDHDPSGVHIDRAIERQLREFAPNADVSFQRVAVRPGQVEEWNLPTRPTKREGNAHAKTFRGDSVEVDAIEPQQLRQLVHDSIVQHIDTHALAVLQTAEKSERETLQKLSHNLQTEDDDD
jgi:hypothetical protein